MRSRILLIIFVLISGYGCSVASINKHRPNFKSVRAVESLEDKFNVKVVTPKTKVVENVDDPHNRAKKHEVHPLLRGYFHCRAAPFYTPQGIPIYKYFENSLTDELDAGGKLDREAGKEIIADIQMLEGDSVGGFWNIKVHYKVDSKDYFIQTAYPFDSAFSAQTACTNMGRTLTEALSENFLIFFNKLPKSNGMVKRQISSNLYQKLVNKINSLEKRVKKLEKRNSPHK